MLLPRNKNQSIGGNRDADARSLVERFVNKIKQCRRVATRYDRLAANDLAFIRLASMRLWLRMNESTRPSSDQRAARGRAALPTKPARFIAASSLRLSTSRKIEATASTLPLRR